jgi:hypothetical protein
MQNVKKSNGATSHQESFFIRNLSIYYTEVITEFRKTFSVFGCIGFAGFQYRKTFSVIYRTQST